MIGGLEMNCFRLDFHIFLFFDDTSSATTGQQRVFSKERKITVLQHKFDSYNAMQIFLRRLGPSAGQKAKSKRHLQTVAI